MVKKLLMMLMAAAMAVAGATGQEKSYDLCHYKDGAVVYRTAVSDVDSIAFAESDSAARVNERLLMGIWYAVYRVYYYDGGGSKKNFAEDPVEEYWYGGTVTTKTKYETSASKYRVDGEKLFIGGMGYTLESVSEDTLKYSFVQPDTKTKIVYVYSHTKPQTDVYSNEAEYVDLGLASGTLWATHNVGANSPEGIGYYFLWGEYSYYDGSSRFGWLLDEMSYDDWKSLGYIDESGNLTESADYVKLLEGEGWVMPTKEEFEELMELPYTKYIRNGVPGYLFLGKNGNTLFLPSAGIRDNKGTLVFRSFLASYWTSTACSNDDGKAYYMSVTSESNSVGALNGFNYLPIRAVRVEKEKEREISEIGEPVDLGLPSGTLWADCNVNAKFNWYDWCDLGDDAFVLSMNGYLDAKGNITETYDMATANWGSDWRLPTKEEMEELLTLKYEVSDKGCKFYGKNGNSLFFPFTTSSAPVGYGDEYSYTSSGVYWSSHYVSGLGISYSYWGDGQSVSIKKSAEMFNTTKPHCSFYVRPVLKKK